MSCLDQNVKKLKVLMLTVHFHVKQLKLTFLFKVLQGHFHTCYRRRATNINAWSLDVMRVRLPSWFLLQMRFELTSVEPEVRCCRVYSQISRAALTCTLRERMTPC